MKKIFLLATLFFSSSLAHSSGLPALSRRWHGNDYQELVSNIENKNIEIPAYSDPNGKKILDKTTSPDNLSPEEFENIPLDIRVKNILEIQYALAKLLFIYSSYANEGMNLHSEIASLVAFTLQSAATGAPLLKQLALTTPHDELDPEWHKKINGIKSGFANILIGAEMSLRETNTFDTGDISLMLKSFSESISSIKTMINDDVKFELIEKFKDLENKMEKEEDTENIKSIIKTLEN